MLKSSVLSNATTVFIGLGSNLGDRHANITEALQQLRSRVHIDQIATIYETQPYGYLDQPKFLNTVVRGTTELAPSDLLHFLKRIEHQMGRQPSFRNAPRPIDMDILVYDDLRVDEDGLRIPHPGIPERAFVLVPLAEIAPDLIIPGIAHTPADMLRTIDRKGVSVASREFGLRLTRDVQGEQPDVAVRLNRVGVSAMHKIIRLAQGGRTHNLQAELRIVADISESQKGLHMSRFTHALDDSINDAVREESPNVETLAVRIAERVVETQNSARSEVEIRAGFPIQKFTPISGLPTEEIYTLIGTAVCKDNRTRRAVGIEAEGMTACPCAQDMILEHSRDQLRESGFGDSDIERILEAVPTAAHNQRSRATLLIGTNASVRAQDLVEIAESSMSSENYTLLKRPDEFFVVHKAHRRPRFVEDVAREMLRATVQTYDSVPDEDFVLARVVSFESIHKHNATAEGMGTLAELRSQILHGKPAEHCTTIEEWLG